MTSRIRSALLSSIAILALLVPTAGWAGAATVTGGNTFEACHAGLEGTCSTDAAADPTGAFSGSVSLTSPDSPSSRSTRYAMALARYTIGFDLDSPAREAVITATLDLDEASASWAQHVPEVFGGPQNESSGAKVLFQLLGQKAPSDCGCGFLVQGSPNVVAARAAEPGASESVSDTQVQVTMTARNPFGDNLLPAGRYEVLFRAYALADLYGAGDWGTLNAAVDGRISGATVTVPTVESVLTLSVDGTGSNRVLTAELTEIDSTPIEGSTISFYGEGELLGTAKTDEKGVATLPVEGKWRGGSRSFSAEFAGDDIYEPASAEASS